MNQFINYKYLILIVLLLNSVNLINCSCAGCVELDELTFDKLIGKFQYTLVKFDIAFPFGEKHEEYSKFARIVAQKYPELLVTLVGIKDYGDKDNSNLGTHYEITDKAYPQILLFTNETIKLKKHLARWPVNLEIDVTNIQKFIRDNTDLYVGMNGCLKEYDLIATEFMKTENKQERLSILEKSKEMMYGYDNNKENQKIARVYILYMEKAIENGFKFLEKEKKRLENLLTAKISQSKLIELDEKLNVLNQFKIPPPKGPNDEL